MEDNLLPLPELVLEPELVLVPGKSNQPVLPVLP